MSYRSSVTHGRQGAEGETRAPWFRSETDQISRTTRLLTASAAATPATRPAIVHDALRGVDCRDAAYLDDICSRTACVRGHHKIFEVRVVDKDEPACCDQRLERRTGVGTRIDSRGNGRRTKTDYRSRGENESVHGCDFHVGTEDRLARQRMTCGEPQALTAFLPVGRADSRFTGRQSSCSTPPA